MTVDRTQAFETSRRFRRRPDRRAARRAVRRRRLAELAPADRAQRPPLGHPRPARRRRRRTSRVSSGWEYPEWFAGPGAHPEIRPGWGRDAVVRRSRPPSTAPSARPSACSTCRSWPSSSSRAATPRRVLNRVCANDVAVPVGRDRLHAVAERARRHRGRPHRHAPRRGRGSSSSSPTSSTGGCAPWIERHAPDGAHVTVTDVTSGTTLLTVQGPRSRELLSRLTSADLSNEAFPYMTAQRDRPRLRAGARDAGHLRRRARLGAARPDRAARSPSTTRSCEAGADLGLPQRRPRRDEQPATREGLPRLRPRHRQHRHAARRRASGSPSPGTSPAGSSGARRCSRRAARAGSAEAPPRPGARRGSGAAPLRRRAGAPRRPLVRVRPGRRLRAHARRRGRAWRWSRTRPGIPADGDRRRPVRGRHRRRRATRRAPRSARCTTRTGCASRPEAAGEPRGQSGADRTARSGATARGRAPVTDRP